MIEGVVYLTGIIREPIQLWSSLHYQSISKGMAFPHYVNLIYQVRYWIWILWL